MDSFGAQGGTWRKTGTDGDLAAISRAGICNVAWFAILLLHS